MGVWAHRGQVAVAGYGHSPVDRRWDGTSMDKTLGAYTMLACQRAMEDAGVTPDQIDGVLCCPEPIAGASRVSVSNWAPRPYCEGWTLEEVRAAINEGIASGPATLLHMEAVKRRARQVMLTSNSF